MFEIFFLYSIVLLIIEHILNNALQVIPTEIVIVVYRNINQF